MNVCVHMHGVLELEPRTLHVHYANVLPLNYIPRALIVSSREQEHCWKVCSF